LKKFHALFAYQILSTDDTLLEVGYINRADAKFIRDSVRGLYGEVKNELVSIIDALAVPDEVLNSPIGMSDGDIYNRFINKMFTAKKTFEKPEYWQEIRANVKWV